MATHNNIPISRGHTSDALLKTFEHGILHYFATKNKNFWKLEP